MDITDNLVSQIQAVETDILNSNRFNIYIRSIEGMPTVFYDYAANPIPEDAVLYGAFPSGTETESIEQVSARIEAL